MMCETKLVLLGTGTPNAEPFASGPSSAVVVDGHAYLVDFGPGVVRQCARAYENGISGDTCPLPVIAENGRGCDILLHEVEYAGGLSQRTPQWQKYHRAVHTLSTDLAEVAKAARPKLLVTYHRIYHLDVFRPGQDTRAEVARREALILQEIREAGYDGPTVNGHDLDVY